MTYDSALHLNSFLLTTYLYPQVYMRQGDHNSSVYLCVWNLIKYAKSWGGKLT